MIADASSTNDIRVPAEVREIPPASSHSVKSYNVPCPRSIKFPLKADISLSDLRSEKMLTSRLAAYHRLRVRRRSDYIGVFLDVAEWRHLVQYIARLESELERREDEAVRAIVVERAAGDNFESARRSAP